MRADPAVRPHPTVRPSFIGDSLVLAGRALRLTWRDPAIVVFSSFFPLVLLLVMPVSFSRVVFPEGSYGDYLDFSLPLFVLMGVTFTTIATAIAVYQDLHGGMTDRLRTLPMAGSAPLVGRIVADAIRSLATVLVVIGVGSVLGFRFQEGLVGVAGFVVLPVLLGFALAWFMVAVVLWSRSGETAVSVINAVLLVLSFLSVGFVPVEALSGWAQGVAEQNPLSLAVEAMRAFAHGGELAGPFVRTVIWCAALTGVFGTLAARRYRHEGVGG